MYLAVFLLWMFLLNILPHLIEKRRFTPYDLSKILLDGSVLTSLRNTV